MGDQRIKDWLVQPIAPGGGGGPFAGGSGGAGQTTSCAAESTVRLRSNCSEI
jgi:hypothetical protein